jgi:hypothetical protein
LWLLGGPSGSQLSTVPPLSSSAASHCNVDACICVGPSKLIFAHKKLCFSRESPNCVVRANEWLSRLGDAASGTQLGFRRRTGSDIGGRARVLPLGPGGGLKAREEAGWARGSLETLRAEAACDETGGEVAPERARPTVIARDGNGTRGGTSGGSGAREAVKIVCGGSGTNSAAGRGRMRRGTMSGSSPCDLSHSETNSVYESWHSSDRVAVCRVAAPTGRVEARRRGGGEDSGKN